MATTQKRGDGYKITVSCGYDIDGKQIRRTKTWKPDAGMTERQIKKERERNYRFIHVGHLLSVLEKYHRLNNLSIRKVLLVRGRICRLLFRNTMRLALYVKCPYHVLHH